MALRNDRSLVQSSLLAGIRWPAVMSAPHSRQLECEPIGFRFLVFPETGNAFFFEWVGRNPSWCPQFAESDKAKEDIVSRTRLAQFSVGVATLVSAIAFAVAVPVAGSGLVSADDGGTSQPTPTPTPDGHGWIG